MTQIRHRTPALRVFSGAGVLKLLAGEIDRAGVERVLVVCSPSARRHPASSQVEQALGARLVDVFDGVREHTPLGVVDALAARIAASGARGLVAVGGGSAIVTARAGVIVAGERRSVAEMATRRRDDGSFHSPRLAAAKLPIWCAPTTPTTAYARVGAAVRDPDSGERLALYDPATRVAGLFFDPELSVTAPVGVFVGAALNAISMAAEGLQTQSADPLAEALLAHGLRTLLEFLAAVITEPAASGPRLSMMYGALLAGQGSEYVGGGLAQTLAHALGHRSTVSNGMLEGILLPHTLRYNLGGAAGALDPVGRALGFLQLGQTGPVDPERVLSAVVEGLRFAEVPGRLRDVGIPRDSISDITADVLDDWFISQVPRAIGRTEVEQLLLRAW